MACSATDKMSVSDTLPKVQESLGKKELKCLRQKEDGQGEAVSSGQQDHCILNSQSLLLPEQDRASQHFNMGCEGICESDS